MRFLILGTNYAPEKTAVAPFTTGLCEYLALQGHNVEVITTFPYYPEWRTWDEYRGRLYKKECVNGVNIHRIRHFVPFRASQLFQRLAHDLSFTLGAFVLGLSAQEFDVIYCACPPPTLALAAYALGKIRRKSYVIKLTDLASDAAVATGIMKDGPAIRAARFIEKFVYDKAETVVCLCRPFVDKLVLRGIDHHKLRVIPDWGDTQAVYPVRDSGVFRAANGIPRHHFVVMHTGNMGRKQDLLNVVRAADLSQQTRDLTWILVGTGEERTFIVEEINRRMLTNIKVLPLQPSDTLPEMYSAADVLLLNQKDSIQDAVIPSKLLTYMSAGLPILAAVNEKCEAARLISDARCGQQVVAENPAALLESVNFLRRNPDLRNGFGSNGRSYVESHFTKERVLQEYSRLFSSYVKGKPQDHRSNSQTILAR